MLHGRCEKNQLAVIDILQCIVFGDMVDTFGDVPYKAANDLAGNPLPAYDKAADIYTILLHVLLRMWQIWIHLLQALVMQMLFIKDRTMEKIWKFTVAEIRYYTSRC